MRRILLMLAVAALMVTIIAVAQPVYADKGQKGHVTSECTGDCDDELPEGSFSSSFTHSGGTDLPGGDPGSDNFHGRRTVDTTFDAENPENSDTQSQQIGGSRNSGGGICTSGSLEDEPGNRC